MELDDTAQLPVSDHRFDWRIQISTPSLIAAEGKFIEHVAAEYVRNVVVAGPPFGTPIVEILPVSRSRHRLATGAEIADGIRHALRVGVCDLSLQAAAKAFLQGCLECVVTHVAEGSGTRNLR